MVDSQQKPAESKPLPRSIQFEVTCLGVTEAVTADSACTYPGP